MRTAELLRLHSELRQALFLAGGRVPCAVLPRGLALDLLKFSDKKAAEIIYKVVYSATSNAENNNGADVDELKVSSIMVDEGPILGQARVPIVAGDTPEALAERVKTAEHGLYPSVLDTFCRGLRRG